MLNITLAMFTSQNNSLYLFRLGSVKSTSVLMTESITTLKGHTDTHMLIQEVKFISMPGQLMKKKFLNLVIECFVLKTNSFIHQANDCRQTTNLPAVDIPIKTVPEQIC